MKVAEDYFVRGHGTKVDNFSDGNIKTKPRWPDRHSRGA